MHSGMQCVHLFAIGCLQLVVVVCEQCLRVRCLRVFSTFVLSVHRSEVLIFRVFQTIGTTAHCFRHADIHVEVSGLFALFPFFDQGVVGQKASVEVR